MDAGLILLRPLYLQRLYPDILFNPSLCDQSEVFVLRDPVDSGTLDQMDPRIGYAGEPSWVVFGPEWEARGVLIHPQGPGLRPT